VNVVAAAGPRAYWYLTRGTGAVALVLLSATVVLGILGQLRFSAAPRWPRFAIETIHRDVSLLVVVLIVLHVLTSVLDGFAPIRLTDAVIPFAGTYRPLWLGLGALSFDLLLAIVVTSLVRRRLGYKRWRAIHWLAYASWPVAVFHGLGTGSDSKQVWMLALTVACVAAVAGAVLVRISRSDHEAPARGPAIALTLVVPLALAVFTVIGPMRQGWSRRAGTPASLGASFATASARVPARARPTQQGSNRTTLKTPFSAQITGTVTQTQEPDGAIIDLALNLAGGAHGQLRVRLAGTPSGGGGISMTGSQVDLLAAGLPSVLDGKIISLQGQQFDAHVSGAQGHALDLHANLNIDSGSGAVTGTLSATSAQ